MASYNPDIDDDFEFNMGRTIDTTLFYHSDVNSSLKSIPGMTDELVSLLSSSENRNGNENEKIETCHQLIGKFLSYCKKNSSYMEARIKFNFWLFDEIGFKDVKKCDMISSCIYYKVTQAFPLF